MNQYSQLFNREGLGAYGAGLAIGLPILFKVLFWVFSLCFIADFVSRILNTNGIRKLMKKGIKDSLNFAIVLGAIAAEKIFKLK